jgi:integrase
MAATSLKLSSRVGPDGKSQVIVKLTISRSQRPCFKSGIWVNPEYFKPVQETRHGLVYGIVPPKKGRFNTAEVKEAREAETRLTEFVNRLTAICNGLESLGGDIGHGTIEEMLSLTRDTPASTITPAFLKEILLSKKEESDDSCPIRGMTFFGVMNFYLERRKLSVSRTKEFRVLMRIMARYELFVRAVNPEMANFEFSIESLDKETLEGFFDYMANEKQLADEYPRIFKMILTKYPAEVKSKRKEPKLAVRGNNTLVGHKKRLKAFFAWLNENGYTHNHPFERVKIGTEQYGTPYYLTLEERNMIADADLSGDGRLETQRDIFIFQCLVGCRVSDLITLRETSIIDGCLQYVPKKTKDKKPVTVSVPLNARASRLVEKYKGVDEAGRLFPFISPQKYNDAIKEVLTACKVKRMVTVLNPATGKEEQVPINEVASSHMARRTFIGCLYRQVQDPNLIGSMSGHVEGSKAFARYRAIDESTKRKVISLIE